MGYPAFSVMGTMAPLSSVDLPMNELDHPSLLYNWD